MYFFLKRLFDLGLSITLIVLLSPAIIIASFLILICDRQNPIFVQKRAGLQGKTFNLYKLQTMKNINNKKQITNLGKTLRISKIDELPQFFNILKNDMSIVGPRPLFMEFNPFYKKKHSSRLRVKPGLTGLAQIKSIKNTDWSKKFNYDYIYVKNACLKFDLYIILKTIFFVFSKIFLKKNKQNEEINYKQHFFQNYNDK